MATFEIKRKELWKSLGNIKCGDWKKAARELGLPVTAHSGGSSHFAIRKPGRETDYSTESLITTIYEGMHKQINQIVFKRLLEYGLDEDDIWRALGKLRMK